jgi:hypothetical protein
MTGALHRDYQLMRSGEVDGPDDIRRSGTPDDQARASIDHGIPNGPRVVVAW